MAHFKLGYPDGEKPIFKAFGFEFYQVLSCEHQLGPVCSYILGMMQNRCTSNFERCEVIIKTRTEEADDEPWQKYDLG